jgi:diaminopimelate epimerase
MATRFDKMHGLGNDFVILDAREQPVDMTAALAKGLADRHTGIGCDQLILLEPSTVADLKMRIWNNDGGEVQSCGNASRCVVALTGAKSLETGGGIVEGSGAGEDVEVQLPAPKFGWEDIPLNYSMDTASLPMGWGPLEKPMAVNVGNPHLVFFVADLRLVELTNLGPSIEHDPAFPERINVNVASVGDDGISLRTWERGSGLTRACGTGACATAVFAIASKRATSPVKVIMQGGTLTIAWQPGGQITMRGGTTHVFTGTIDLGSFKP